MPGISNRADIASKRAQGKARGIDFLLIAGRCDASRRGREAHKGRPKRLGELPKVPPGGFLCR
jgi:hypothetical protein